MRGARCLAVPLRRTEPNIVASQLHGTRTGWVSLGWSIPGTVFWHKLLRARQHISTLASRRVLGGLNPIPGKSVW